MYLYLAWFLILIPIPIAAAVFLAGSRKSLLGGYLLGLIPIFLVWQIVSIVMLPDILKDMQRPRGGGGTGLYFLLFYGYLILVFIYYTVLSLSLGTIYRWVVRKAHIRRRAMRFLITCELAARVRRRRRMRVMETR